MTRKVGVIVGASVALLILVAATGFPWALDQWRVHVALRPEFQSTISHGSESEIQGMRVTHSEALSGILEIGDTRLVFPGLTFTATPTRSRAG